MPPISSKSPDSYVPGEKLDNLGRYAKIQGRCDTTPNEDVSYFHSLGTKWRICPVRASHKRPENVACPTQSTWCKPILAASPGHQHIQKPGHRFENNVDGHLFLLK
jgi:hypothetical protein